jgi:hypothetical protein
MAQVVERSRGVLAGSRTGAMLAMIPWIDVLAKTKFQNAELSARFDAREDGVEYTFQPMVWADNMLDVGRTPSSTIAIIDLIGSHLQDDWKLAWKASSMQLLSTSSEKR